MVKTYKQFINEKINNNLDLSNFNIAKKWIIEQNLDDVVNEEGDDLDYSYRDSYTGMDIEEIIYDYVYLYNSVISKDEIEIYRLIRLNSIEELELDNIGEYWSFNEKGVGDYGSGRREFKGEKKYVFTGIINPDDIDWESGFYSFIYYPNQYECNLKNNVSVLITEINGIKLKKQLKSKNGNT